MSWKYRVFSVWVIEPVAEPQAVLEDVGGGGVGTDLVGVNCVM